LESRIPSSGNRAKARVGVAPTGAPVAACSEGDHDNWDHEAVSILSGAPAQRLVEDTRAKYLGLEFELPETVRLKALSLSLCGASPQLESENQETMTTKFKLILGGILLLFGIIFAMQNSTVVEVRFLVWSVQMSQALVIFLTGAVGTIIGFLFGTAFKISRQS
jgi:uncharacterized integral membrane protein